MFHLNDICYHYSSRDDRQVGVNYGDCRIQPIIISTFTFHGVLIDKTMIQLHGIDFCRYLLLAVLNKNSLRWKVLSITKTNDSMTKRCNQNFFLRHGYSSWAFIWTVCKCLRCLISLTIKITHNSYLSALFSSRTCSRMCRDPTELFTNDAVTSLELKRNMSCYCEKLNE